MCAGNVRRAGISRPRAKLTIFTGETSKVTTGFIMRVNPYTAVEPQAHMTEDAEEEEEMRRDGWGEECLVNRSLSLLPPIQPLSHSLSHQ